ncbi:hypothetical protein SD71_06935 [Cohnella kolymensis]|uniref:Uncharacterized protein n=1 Tax=Cohnella kolymensis TaxID=1590652 RepID=A0ABR5A6T0_9BACL|nr:hypothetical protein SD71_06935 [Cohnella kolymensis]
MPYPDQNIDLVEKTNNRWLLYMIVSLISAVSLLGFPLLMLPLLITVLFIFAIVVLVLMMDLMKKCEAQLS